VNQRVTWVIIFNESVSKEVWLIIPGEILLF